MDLDRIPVIGMLVRRMEFLGARQRVIAQNVANADTPATRRATWHPTASPVTSRPSRAAPRPAHRRAWR
ncbi:hypothetical protein [Oleomonas cavernae]|uniref:hypothetical protein n=1 Tax=Oleomonas cavernae TaxID=2320859 RepID=UPI0011C4963A|nr:hypothetical protein [Oleomonas cavernae]